MAITLSIAGADRSSIVFRNSISVQMRSNGQQWTASFTLRVLEGTYRPLVGQAVAIAENGVARFLGTIDEVTEDRIVGGSGNSQVWLRCLCTDLSARLGQRFASTPKTYKDQTAGAILLDVLGTHGTGEGITFAASTSGGKVYSGADVTKYVVDHQSVAQIADDLARLSGFIWGVSPTGVLYFHARTAQNAAWSINYSTLNYTKISSRKTREDYYNESWTRISWEAFAPTVETFHGSGSTRTWNLAHEAARVESITLNGTEVEWGGEGEGRKYTWFYGETGITQDSGETLLTGTDDLVVTYRELGTDWIYVHDDYAIGERASVEGNSGHYGKTLEETDQTNATAADEKATAALTTAAVIPIVVTIETIGSYFQPSPGEVATISTDAPVIGGSYLVQEISAQQEGDWFRYTITALNGTRIGNWIDYFKALADQGVANPAATGSATTTGTGGDAADAPNISAATATEYIDSETQLAGIQGTITLPTSDPDYDSLRQIAVVARGPGSDTREVLLATVYSPWVGASVDYKSDAVFECLSDEAWHVEFRCVNPDGKITAGPHTVSVTLHETVVIKALVGVAASEDATSRRLSVANQVTETPINITLTRQTGDRAEWVEVWFYDAHSGEWGGSEGRWAIGDPITLWRPIWGPEYTGSGYRVRALIGNSRGEMAFADAVESAAFDIAGLGLPSDQAVYDIAVSTPYDVTRNGLQQWWIDSLSWTASASEQYGWYVTWRARFTDAQGNPAPDDRGGQWTPWNAQEQQFVPGKAYSVEIGNWGYQPEDAAQYHYLELEVAVAQNTHDDSPTLVLQKWPDGSTRSRVDIGSLNGAIEAAYGQCTSTGVTGAHFVPNAAGSLMIFDRDSIGTIWWHWWGLDWTQPTEAIDPNYDFSFLSVQKGYEDGSGVWHPAPDYEGQDEQIDLYPGRWVTDSGMVQGGVSLPGSTVQIRTETADWTFPPVYNSDGTANPYRTFRFWLSSVSKAARSSAGAQNAVKLQVTAWNGADHYDLTPPAQPASLDLREADPNTLGPGTRKNPTTRRVEINPGSTVSTDGTGALEVVNKSLRNLHIANGEIGADLATWTSTAKPWGFYYGLPSPFGANVPEIIINTAENPWRIYNKVGGSWVAQKVQPGDIVAGTITALVQLLAPSIIGGAYTSTLPNGTVITIDGSRDPVLLRNYFGMRVVNTAGIRAYFNEDGVSIYNNSGASLAAMYTRGVTNAGEVLVADPSGVNSCALIGESGRLYLTGPNAAVYINGVKKL